MDSDHDGKITKEEVLNIFAKVDKNSDGAVTREELLQAIATFAKPDQAPKADAPRGAEGPPPRGPQTGGHPHGPPPGRFGRHGFGRGPAGGGPGGPGHHGPPSAEAVFQRFDKDHKGSLSKSDVPEQVWEHLSKADANQDGNVTKEELETFMKSHRPGGPAATPATKPADPPKNEEQQPKAGDSRPNALLDLEDSPIDALAAQNPL